MLVTVRCHKIADPEQRFCASALQQNARGPSVGAAVDRLLAMILAGGIIMIRVEAETADSPFYNDDRRY